jgi:uncharacterized protein (TIGR02722 family)
MKHFKLFSLLILLLLFVGCSSSSREVKRIDTREIIDISGRWNDTDSRLVAEEMVTDLLAHPWLDQFIELKAKKPVLVVGKIRNKSSEHIPIDAFAKDIERELINSGQITFVASMDERKDVREERKDQQDFASSETFKKFYREIGADYLMSGVVTSIEDAFEGDKVIYYQIDLELIDIERNTKVWLGNKKIKKLITQDDYKY